MKRRLLLLMVSFFAMTSTFASLKEAYKLYFTGAGAAQGTDVVLSLNLKNQKAISTWQADLVLPAGVTVKDYAIVDTRFGANQPTANFAPQADGSIRISCEMPAGTTISGTDGVLATITVSVAANATVGANSVLLKNQVMVDAEDGIHNYTQTEFILNVEAGASIVGDVNGDGIVGIADIQAIQNVIAGEENPNADVNGDGVVGVADIQAVLNIIAGV